ncbi:MAG: protease modulator HflK [Candidatus Binatia bacterium]
MAAPVPTGRRRLGRLIVPLVLALWAASGLYSVQSDESAVAFVFGRAVGRDVLPGIHWNPPRPIGRVIVETTTTNFTMPVGYRFLPRPGVMPISDLWLTGDANIVTVRLNVQYSIVSLTEFVLSNESPRELVRRAGERALTGFLVAEGVDAVLTTKRHDLTESVHRATQELLDAEGVGVAVRSVTLQELAPPAEGGVRAAFQEVQNASADRERTVYEAGAYRAQTLAEAEGEAQTQLSAGAADSFARIELARGESARFLAIAHEHARAPIVTEQRLYLETIDRVLPTLRTYVVQPGRNGKVNLRIVQ